jgi:hypothetical protein
MRIERCKWVPEQLLHAEPYPTVPKKQTIKKALLRFGSRAWLVLRAVIS